MPLHCRNANKLIRLDLTVEHWSMVKRSGQTSSCYFGPLVVDLAYFTPPMGQIGVHQLPEIYHVEITR